jgi:hypothetical protein
MFAKVINKNPVGNEETGRNDCSQTFLHLETEK